MGSESRSGTESDNAAVPPGIFSQVLAKKSGTFLDEKFDNRAGFLQTATFAGIESTRLATSYLFSNSIT